MSEEKSQLVVRENQDVCVVEFEEKKILEELSIQQIGDELTGLVDSRPNIKMVLNFRNVEHLSSAALGMLINLRNRVNEKDGQLRLSNIKPQIFEVFKITQLHKLFEIHETAAQAINAF